MKCLKSLVIIVLLTVFSMVKGQTDDSLLNQIDFSDTSLIEGDFMWQTIAEYITKAQESDTNPKNQAYMTILAADNVLSRSAVSYPMYLAVYQYLITGFSELGMNMVVDYLVRMPYLEYLHPDEEQINTITKISESYCRVKIGMEAPDIHAITINELEFDLNSLSKMVFKPVKDVGFAAVMNEYNQYKFENSCGYFIFESQKYLRISDDNAQSSDTYEIVNDYDLLSFHITQEE